MVNRCWLNGHVITYHTPTLELRQISEKSTHFQLATNQLATNQLASLEGLLVRAQ
jgi:hypothetical protein